MILHGFVSEMDFQGRQCSTIMCISSRASTDACCIRLVAYTPCAFARLRDLCSAVRMKHEGLRRPQCNTSHALIVVVLICRVLDDIHVLDPSLERGWKTRMRHRCVNLDVALDMFKQK